jgi:adenosylcobinamide-phosphate guanylyltransferase
MIGAIMCGGLGSRMGEAEEKPMIALGGRRFVERVLAALKESGSFTRIVAAASPNAPKTREFLSTLDVEMMDTPGKGYPQDLSLLLSALAPERVIVVPADIPLLTAGVVRDMVAALSLHDEPAVSIVMDRSFVEGLGVRPSVVVGSQCHSGITLFDTGQICNSAVDERYVTMNRREIAVNVNTKREKELAELLVQDAQDLAHDKGL